MLIEQTTERLYAMKLVGMADAFKGQLAQPDLNVQSFEERFALLVDRRWIWKEDRRIHTAHKIILKGGSMLKIRSPLTKGKNSVK